MKPLLATISALVVVSAAPDARADESAAEAKFNAGLAHFKAQNYGAACPEFRESEILDPNPSTEYYLAKCAIQEQHAAQAWNLFKRAAAGLDDPKQRSRAEQGATDLNGRVGIIALVGTEPAPGLEVRIDADVVTSLVLVGMPFAVEPGAHVLVATAPDRTEWKREFTIAQGESLSFTVPSLPSTDPGPARPPDRSGAAGPSGRRAPTEGPIPDSNEARRTPSGSSRGRRALTYVAAGVGVAGLVTGSVFGVLAMKKWDDATAGCTAQGGSYVGCPAGADRLRQDASTRATVSTVGFIVGGTGLAAAAVLYLTAPRAHRTHVLPVVSSNGVGVGVAGRF